MNMQCVLWWLVSGERVNGDVSCGLFRMHWNFDACEHFLEKAKDHYLKLVSSE